MWQASKHGNYAFEAIMRMLHVPNHGKFVSFYFEYRKSQQERNVARSVSTSMVTNSSARHSCPCGACRCSKPGLNLKKLCDAARGLLGSCPTGQNSMVLNKSPGQTAMYVSNNANNAWRVHHGAFLRMTHVKCGCLPIGTSPLGD
jgi:hypothetical protein